MPEPIRRRKPPASTTSVLVAVAAELVPLQFCETERAHICSCCAVTYVVAQCTPDAESGVALEHASDLGIEHALALDVDRS